MTTLGLNAAATLAAKMLGIRNDPYAAFNFLVEIEGLIIGGFSEVSGLQVETAVEDYQEGGQNEYVHKLPGPARYPSNLILKRGLTDIETLWTWHQEVIAGTIERKNGARGVPFAGLLGELGALELRLGAPRAAESLHREAADIFRQLPAGVKGAYRLFANLVSAEN